MSTPYAEAVSDALLTHQRQEPDVTTSIVTAVEIRVRRFRDKTKTVNSEEFRQIATVFAIKVEVGSLCESLGRRTLTKLSCPPNRLFSSGKVVVQQHSGGHERGTGLGLAGTGLALPA